MLVYAFLADGSEEVECLAVADVLKRAGVDVRLVSVMQEREIVSSHGIHIVCDAKIDEVSLAGADVLFLPGGMPGTRHLGACKTLVEALKAQLAAGGRVAAICAAPSVLGANGLLEGKQATCYPGFEGELRGAQHTHTGVVTDGLVTTARGLGYALDLGLELVRLLVGAEQAAEIKAAIQYDQV